MMQVHRQILEKRGTSFYTQDPRAHHLLIGVMQAGLTIGMLPDVPLLAIFDCYLHESRRTEAWKNAGARVSKMANLVFGVTTSPQSSTCLHGQATREGDAGNLAALVAIVIFPYGFSKTSTLAADNIVAALEHNDRIRHVELWEVQARYWIKLWQ